jgi:hypothetical protein
MTPPHFRVATGPPQDYGDTVYARCNFDGKEISPEGKLIIDTFKLWLQMDDNERREAIRLDPKWRRWLGIKK